MAAAMTARPGGVTAQSVGQGYSTTSADYDAAVQHNIEGAHRLIDAMPDLAYARVLDVGCGTGVGSLAMVERFPSVHHITAIDPSAGMLAQFRDKLGAARDVEVSLVEAGVDDMDVPAGAFDAAIATMSFHWFPHKTNAALAIARALRPRGVMAAVLPGEGVDEEFRRILATIEPPHVNFLGSFQAAPRSLRHMDAYLAGAGLEIIDMWSERRLRRTPVDAYLERMRVVAGHLGQDMPERDLALHLENLRDAMLREAGPRGFEYEFVKLYAIARRPE
jgi:ubiquinone/menaquinone biosynthesis C-methylase UbiE